MRPLCRLRLPRGITPIEYGLVVLFLVVGGVTAWGAEGSQGPAQPITSNRIGS